MNNQDKKENERKASFTLIIIFITLSLATIESVFILLKMFRQGFLKSEVLTKKTNLGCDVQIIMK